MTDPRPPTDRRLGQIILEGESPTRLSPLLEADRAQAVADLAADNSFSVVGHENAGPYLLRLSIFQARLQFDIRQADDTPLVGIGLALGPFRGLMKDYELLVDSYAKAIEEGREARIQAIDMGRRGLHNEGANLMMQRLDGKVVIDFETARRLFTLVCVLHTRV